MWGHVTGWINPALGSATGIEQEMNQVLSGTAGSQFLARLERIVTGQPPRGSNVVLSLDAAVQRAAFERWATAGRRDRHRAGHRTDARDGVEPRPSTRTCSPRTTRRP